VRGEDSAFGRDVAVVGKAATARAFAQQPRVLVEPFERRLQSLPLSADLWLVSVVDREGTVLAGGIGDNLEDAVLELARDLLPPSE
jgi:hypothetical protein